MSEQITRTKDFRCGTCHKIIMRAYRNYHMVNTYAGDKLFVRPKMLVLEVICAYCRTTNEIKQEQFEDNTPKPVIVGASSLPGGLDLKKGAE